MRANIGTQKNEKRRNRPRPELTRKGRVSPLDVSPQRRQYEAKLRRMGPKAPQRGTNDDDKAPSGGTSEGRRRGDEGCEGENDEKGTTAGRRVGVRRALGREIRGVGGTRQRQ